MSFDPSHWLDTADRLAGREESCGPEASLRAAVNRAYYAALMRIARRVIDERGSDPFAGSTSTHSMVKRGLERASAPVLRKVLDELRILEEMRGRADYVLSWACVWDDADEAMNRGRRLVAKIDSLNARYFKSLPVG